MCVVYFCLRFYLQLENYFNIHKLYTIIFTYENLYFIFVMKISMLYVCHGRTHLGAGIGTGAGLILSEGQQTFIWDSVWSKEQISEIVRRVSGVTSLKMSHLHIETIICKVSSVDEMMELP